VHRTIDGGPSARNVAIPSVLWQQVRLLIVPPVRQTRIQHEHHACHYGQGAQHERVDNQVPGHAVHGCQHQTANGDEQRRTDDQQKRFLQNIIILLFLQYCDGNVC